MPETTNQNDQAKVAFAVYNRPSDYPDFYVVRRWVIGDGPTPKDGGVHHLAKNLDEARKTIPRHRLVRMGPEPTDPDYLVETWL
jgi:hypothetical protein